ncbi:hypothetical protein TUMEXPCC7403_03170 [Tumidithrix helvetica PCC 7403]|uniref:DUF29 family protein n=1 Tax=Tumidithrix helvetica TaxID=3457545 RepID=UPI003C9DEB92
MLETIATSISPSLYERDYLLWVEETVNQLKLTPSLRNYFTIVFDEIYADALSEARIEYPHSQFPDRWQFEHAVDAILSTTFWHQE